MKKSRATTEDTLSKVNRILGITESYKAPEAMMNMLFDEQMRENKFKQFLEAFDYEMDREWFYEYFEDEHADRKNKKQDFTPESVSRLMAEILRSNDMDKEGYEVIEEPAAGCGSTIIQHWNYTRKGTLPWTFRPDDYLYVLTEKASKTIPFLLFNLMIRGMNALVFHGDSLTQEYEAVYWIYNEKNTAMVFSDIYKVNKTVAPVQLITKMDGATRAISPYQTMK